MKLHNTLSRKVETVQPQSDHVIKLYTCGPTVYDYLHIGNWVAYLRWDLLARTLAASGFSVNWYMNITDVGHLVSDADEGEDKLEKGARREGKSAWEIADFYTKDFEKGLHELNITVPIEHLVKATDHIDEQLELIKKLEAKGYTYTIGDGVYFDTGKLSDYGKLGHVQLDKLKPVARVVGNPDKKQATDFALWKFSPKSGNRDMEWDSPWGKGFPGWHLECSAMAMKYLGETLDIHAGGIDHIPTHHTNEIAQSEAATGKAFAKLWVHSNFLLVNNSKISKSLGNGYTLADLKKRGYSAMDFRLFVLQSHYRNESNFTWEGLAAAQNRLRVLQALADLRYQTSVKSAALDSKLLDNTYGEILLALQDDLNSPRALEALGTLENHLSDKTVSDQDKPSFVDFLKKLDDLLGLGLLASPDISEAQKQLIDEREEARQSKQWAKADALRAQLLEEKVSLRDTDSGPIWFRP